MHDWMHENKLPASVMKFVDAMQQLRCPQCHASMLALNIEFGMTPLRSHSKYIRHLHFPVNHFRLVRAGAQFRRVNL
jgi:hypothetical protein